GPAGEGAAILRLPPVQPERQTERIPEHGIDAARPHFRQRLDRRIVADDTELRKIAAEESLMRAAAGDRREGGFRPVRVEALALRGDEAPGNLQIGLRRDEALALRPERIEAGDHRIAGAVLE